MLIFSFRFLCYSGKYLKHNKSYGNLVVTDNLKVNNGRKISYIIWKYFLVFVSTAKRLEKQEYEYQCKEFIDIGIHSDIIHIRYSLPKASSASIKCFVLLFFIFCTHRKDRLSVAIAREYFLHFSLENIAIAK